MKILHIVENLDSRYGGPAKSVPLLVKYLYKLGVENTIFTIKEYEEESNPVLDEYNYDIKKAKIFGIKKIKYSKEFEKLLRQEITDDTIIHIHAIWTYPVYVGYKIAKKYNIPYIVATRGMMYDWCLNQSKFVKQIAMNFYVKDMLKNANIIHITEKGEEIALNSLGIYPKCSLIPNGIELDNKYDSLDQNILDLISYDENKRYIMFLGRIVKKKGLIFLVNAFKRLVVKYDDIELLIVGNIEDANYFNCLKIDNSEKICYLNSLDGIQKHTILKISNMLVAPSYNENFGMVIAEAMSYKTPIITTKGTPWKEIEEKDAGWWVELNQNNIDNAIDEALSCSKEELKAKGIRGYDIIKHYTWDKQALKMKKSYEEILNKRNK